MRIIKQDNTYYKARKFILESKKIRIKNGKKCVEESKTMCIIKHENAYQKAGQCM